MRGGAWSFTVTTNFRAAYRNGNEPVNVNDNHGLRVARSASTQRASKGRQARIP